MSLFHDRLILMNVHQLVRFVQSSSHVHNHNPDSSISIKIHQSPPCYHDASTLVSHTYVIAISWKNNITSEVENKSGMRFSDPPLVELLRCTNQQCNHIAY